MASETSNSAAALTTNVLTRTGYTFSGWNTAANGSGTAYAGGASYGFGVSVTLYAQWAINVYTVTFNANGGTGSMSNESSSASEALSVNTFSYSGYTFSGWNTQANGNGTLYADGASYGFNSSVTLYAQWTADVYTVTFSSNGGTGSMPGESSTSPEALSTNTFARTGYTFSGWTTQANGGGTAYAGGASYAFSSNATLYAQWTASYSVTFSANGGTGSMAAETSSTSENLSTNAFTRSGYSFVNWNSAANGSGTSYSNGATYGFGSNITLYAQWSATSAPVVTLSPTSQVVLSGTTATFTASASGSPSPSVQWSVSSNDGGSWSAINGATSSSYGVTSTEFDSGYEYEAVFTNAGGTATSAAAQLTFLTTSGNWSGYVDTGGTFSAVSAKWVVPTVTCSGTGNPVAVQWVGIDGWGSATVEQDGTETSCAGATPEYSAWYEMYGDDSVNNNFLYTLSPGTYPVRPGDSMTGSVQLSGDVWTLEVIDHTAGWTSSTVITDSAASAATAEVIVESPSSCSGSCTEDALANFGAVTFTNASVTSSTTGTGGSIISGTVEAVDCTDSSGVTMMSVGALSGGGTSFTDTWEASS